MLIECQSRGVRIRINVSRATETFTGSIRCVASESGRMNDSAREIVIQRTTQAIRFTGNEEPMILTN